MKNLNKYSITFLFLHALIGCSSVPDCPFGCNKDKCDEMTVTIYLPPVVSDLSYKDISVTQNQAIILGGFQHTLSLADNKEGNSSLQTFPLSIPESSRPEIQLVQFEFNRSDLTATETEKLDYFLQKFRPETLMHVSIEAHADAIGYDAYNLKLSKKRAQWVQKYLIKHGIASSKISAKGFGEALPVESNKTPEGRALNRRADLIPLTDK